MRLSELLDWADASLPDVVEDVSLKDSSILPREIDLVHEYTKLNRVLYDGKLGIYPMKWNRRKGSGAIVKWRKQRSRGSMQSHIGMGVLFHDGRPGTYDDTIQIISIEVSTFFESSGKMFLDRLAHEMIHVYLLEQGIDDGHGPRFRAEMRRINAMNLGIDITITESVSGIKTSAEASGKGVRRGIVLVDDQIISIYGPKNFPDTLYELLVGMRQSWISQRQFAWYWSDAPWLARYPSARTLGRSFKSYRITPEQVEDIKKGELIATVSAGVPKLIKPANFNSMIRSHIERGSDPHRVIATSSADDLRASFAKRG